jgi:hypothetical protein
MVEKVHQGEETPIEEVAGGIDVGPHKRKMSTKVQQKYSYALRG